DPALQTLSAEYGFDGAIPEEPGDFLLLTDTSVNSTKLNLILENTLDVRVHLDPDTGAATTALSYGIANPFPDWQQGRDPRLVEALMLRGVYGSYLRLYAPPTAQLLDVRIGSRTAGAEQIDTEGGKRVF